MRNPIEERANKLAILLENSLDDIAMIKEVNEELTDREKAYAEAAQATIDSINKLLKALN